MNDLTLIRTPGWLSASLLATLFAGCAPADGPEANDDDSRAVGTVEGRVTDGTGAPVPRAVVRAVHVGADGERTAVSDGEVTADADGSYSIGISLTGGASLSDIVVVADGVGSVIVAQAVESGGVTAAATIDVETTAEAEVFVGLSQDGMWDPEVMSTHELMSMIDAELGAALDGEVAGSASVSAVGDAVASAMAAASLTTDLLSGLGAFAQGEPFARAAASVEAALMTSSGSEVAGVVALTENLLEAQASAMVSAAAQVTAELSLSAEADMVIAEASADLEEAVSTTADAAGDVWAVAQGFQRAAEDWGVAVMGAVQTDLDVQQQLTMGAVFDAAAEAHGVLEAELAGSPGAVAGNARAAAEAFATFFASFEGSEALGGLSAEGMSDAEVAATASVVGSAFSSFGGDLGFLSGITLGAPDVDLSGDSIEVLAIDAGGALSSLTGGGAGTSSGAFLASLDLGAELGDQQIVEVTASSGATLSALTTIDGEGAFFGGLALTEETTAEAGAMVELLASGAFDPAATGAGELQAMVTAGVARAMLEAGGAAESEVSAVFALAVEARQELLIALGESQTTVDLAIDAMAAAQATLDEALFVATTDAEATAATAANADAMATAWTDAGMDAVAATWVELVELASTVTFQDELMTDPGLSAATQLEYAFHVARALEAGIGQELANFGVSAAGMVQLEALVAQLEVNLAGASGGPAEVEAAIGEAMASFEAGMVALLISEAGTGFEATAMATYAGSAGTQADLLAASLHGLSLDGGADALVDALLDFQADISGATATNGMSLVAMSTAEIDAVASIVAMMTVAGVR